jgi:photosystem II stability/assembly factor-like uncharacterized protein
LFLLLAFAVQTQAWGGWEKVGLDNTTSGPAILYIQFFDDNNGVIAGEYGYIRYTRDGGVTWRQPKLPRLSAAPDEDIVAGSRQGHTLYLLTSRHLLRSKNDVDSWEVMKPPKDSVRLREGPGLDVVYIDMTFVNEREGWVLCGVLKKEGNGFIFLQSYSLHTTDAGDSWRPTELNTGRREMKRMHFSNRRHGWIVGQEGTILQTNNGGDNWEELTYSFPGGAKVSGPKPMLQDVDLKKDIGIIVGNLGTILRTEDGGRRWVLTPLPGVQSKSKRGNLKRVQMVDEDHAWIVGESGSILSTANGGKSWMPQGSPTNKNLYAIFMNNRKQGWAAGNSKTLLRYDADDD